jgi:hypothetical protein
LLTRVDAAGFSASANLTGKASHTANPIPAARKPRFGQKLQPRNDNDQGFIAGKSAHSARTETHGVKCG